MSGSRGIDSMRDAWGRSAAAKKVLERNHLRIATLARVTVEAFGLQHLREKCKLPGELFIDGPDLLGGAEDFAWCFAELAGFHPPTRTFLDLICCAGVAACRCKAASKSGNSGKKKRGGAPAAHRIRSQTNAFAQKCEALKGMCMATSARYDVRYDVNPILSLLAGCMLFIHSFSLIFQDGNPALDQHRLNGAICLALDNALHSLASTIPIQQAADFQGTFRVVERFVCCVKTDIACVQMCTQLNANEGGKFTPTMAAKFDRLRELVRGMQFCDAELETELNTKALRAVRCLCSQSDVGFWAMVGWQPNLTRIVLEDRAGWVNQLHIAAVFRAKVAESAALAANFDGFICEAGPAPTKAGPSVAYPLLCTFCSGVDRVDIHPEVSKRLPKHSKFPKLSYHLLVSSGVRLNVTDRCVTLWKKTAASEGEERGGGDVVGDAEDTRSWSCTFSLFGIECAAAQTPATRAEDAAWELVRAYVNRVRVQDADASARGGKWAVGPSAAEEYILAWERVARRTACLPMHRLDRFVGFFNGHAFSKRQTRLLFAARPDQHYDYVDAAVDAFNRVATPFIQRVSEMPRRQQAFHDSYVVVSLLLLQEVCEFDPEIFCRPQDTYENVGRRQNDALAPTTTILFGCFAVAIAEWRASRLRAYRSSGSDTRYVHMEDSFPPKTRRMLRPIALRVCELLCSGNFREPEYQPSVNSVRRALLGQKVCEYCQKDVNGVLQCSKCLTVCFCDRECFRKCWKNTHKRRCQEATVPCTATSPGVLCGVAKARIQAVAAVARALAIPDSARGFDYRDHIAEREACANELLRAAHRCAVMWRMPGYPKMPTMALISLRLLGEAAYAMADDNLEGFVVFNDVLPPLIDKLKTDDAFAALWETGHGNTTQNMIFHNADMYNRSRALLHKPTFPW